ncbi:glycine cleavage system protein GcvH [Maridesulfovibrio ferrireducens]|uniref:Glycine cleavage system H protein n=1 Tax=Maridesulfovibrio ferrireducens TaxID=246191 RepID=A0A1G9J7X2_9BACT|nr:glycine cleavage system protein GcvH [Maridesulfovibrio ferrireducens]MBI9112620.1 glycine cleavage system protein GcvH [Maridesulfovibrio ferrireducens]SDL33402.1 glycine cleavage system H protein [Maridesulfovibrio ferrireducens]
MIPQELLYAKSHEWLKVEGENGTIGITHFAQEQLGDLTFIELPQKGDTFEAGDEFGSIESVKAASEVYAPVACEVIAVNESLEDAPEKVNDDPYGEGWLIKVKITGPTEDLMDASAYQEVTEEDAH